MMKYGNGFVCTCAVGTGRIDNSSVHYWKEVNFYCLIWCEMKKLGFLFFGRLEDEKGFGDIIELIKYFLEKGEDLPFDVFVFGEGKYEEAIEDLVDVSKRVHYFGYQPLKTIYRYVQNCDYCLMPSKVIETFGLSALASLGFGLPVVGYKRGGLENFVFDELNLLKFEGDNMFEQLKSFVKKVLAGKVVSVKEYQKLRDRAIGISDDYHLVEWEKKVKELLNLKSGRPSTSSGGQLNNERQEKKILLVTDFVSRIGGIEEHVLMSKEVLGKIGNEVSLIGNKIPSGFLGKIWKIFGVSFLANLNIVFAIRLFFRIKKIKPDVIRFHSVLRQIGWLGFVVVKLLKKNMEINVLWTIHDMGYFCPLPSRLEKVNDVRCPLDKKNFSKMLKNVNFVKKIFLSLKFLNVFLLKKFSKKVVDKFLVPSKFLKNVVKKSYEINDEKIVVIEHFV